MCMCNSHLDQVGYVSSMLYGDSNKRLCKTYAFMIGDPVSVVLKYMTSDKIFVTRIKGMDKYVLFPHFVCVY